MRVEFNHEYNRKTFLLRAIELIPSICLCFHADYKLESIRLSWLGVNLNFEL